MMYRNRCGGYVSTFDCSPPLLRLPINRVDRIYTFITLFTIFNVWIVNIINEYIIEPVLRPINDGYGELGASLASSASGLTQTVLFSSGPAIFKLLAGVEGSSTSMAKVEQKAMIFFWYFYIVARFLGQIVWQMFISFAQGGECVSGANDGRRITLFLA